MLTIHQPPSFDFLFLFTSIAMRRSRDTSRINDLISTGVEAMRSDV
jgi:hypothetical protein